MATPLVVVVGAGPAGVRAAQRLAQAGLRPMLIDEGRRGGGQIYRRQPDNFSRPLKALYGFEAGKAGALHTTADGLAASIDYRPLTLAWGIYDGALHIEHAGRTEIVRYDALILASGATDRVMPVPGWTLPGVFTLGGAQIALKAQACTIGAKPVLLGTGPLLTLVAYQYAKAGVPPVAVLDVAPFSHRLMALGLLSSRASMLAKGVYYSAGLIRRRVRVLTGVTPVAIEGGERVEAVTVRDSGGRPRRFPCDAVGIGYGLRSETQLADLAGCRFSYDDLSRQFLPDVDADGRSSVPKVYLAGDGTRVLGADAAELAGRLAAIAALADLGQAVDASEQVRLRGRLRAMATFRRGLEVAFPWPAHLAATLPDDTIVCRCEAITAGEIRRSANDLGAPEVNRAKAFVRVGMGRCQGRYCGLAGAEVLAAARDVPLEEVGRLRGQAPVKPLPLAAQPEPAP